jgi:hypothetical protein
MFLEAIPETECGPEPSKRKKKREELVTEALKNLTDWTREKPLHTQLLIQKVLSNRGTN